MAKGSAEYAVNVRVVLQVRDEYEADKRVAEVYAFTSAKKMASILVRRDESTLRLYNKGAAEWVLKRCVSLHNEYGEVVPMTDAIREELLQVRLQHRLLPCSQACAVLVSRSTTLARQPGIAYSTKAVLLSCQ